MKIRGNHGVGVSIGHKDTDNLFRGNLISANAKAGVLFRERASRWALTAMSSSPTASSTTAPRKAGASIVIRGHHDDLVFRKNTIGCPKGTIGGIGIRCAKESNRLQADDNQFVNLQKPIERAER